MDALIAVVGSLTTPVVASVLQDTGIGEFFKAKLPDPVASEVCLKEPSLCVSVGVLDWQRSVMEGPSNV
jgi:hypothetical protein